MAEPIPQSAPAAEHRCGTLDDAIEHCIGNFSRTQLFQSMILSFAWFFDAQQMYIAIFTDVVPKWSCTNQHLCHGTANLCELPQGSWSWELLAHVSTVSEWSLECSRSIVSGLPASSFFFGCLVGGFVLATLADSSLGRKNLLALTCLIMSLAGALSAVSTSVWIYAGLRFFSGFGRAAIVTSSLVLASELVGKKWRGTVGIIGTLLFAFGFLSLPVIAFVLKGRSWRLIYLSCSLPCILYSLIVFFFIHESPRWLFIKGRKEEFSKTVRSLASKNSNVLPENYFIEHIESSKVDNIYSAMKVLLQKRWAIRRLLSIMAAALGVGMVYIGVPLGLGNLSFNLYLSASLNGLLLLPGGFVALFLIDKLKRVDSLLALALMSGTCSVACVVVRQKAFQIGLELASFFGAATAMGLVMIYSLELFPTCVRNSAVSMLRQAIVVSGVVSPLLVVAGRKNMRFSYGVFGVMIVVCVAPVWWLPETRGQRLSDTMDEEESKNAENASRC